MKETSKMLLLPWPALPLFGGSSLFLKGSKQIIGNHHSHFRELEGIHLRRDAPGVSTRGHTLRRQDIYYDPKSTVASRFLRADGLLLIHGKDDKN